MVHNDPEYWERALGAYARATHARHDQILRDLSGLATR
jgi:hypothetical protein